jgi:hypothetical protein
MHQSPPLEQGQVHGVGSLIHIKRNKYVIQSCGLLDQAMQETQPENGKLLYKRKHFLKELPLTYVITLKNHVRYYLIAEENLDVFNVIRFNICSLLILTICMIVQPSVHSNFPLLVFAISISPIIILNSFKSLF